MKKILIGVALIGSGMLLMNTINNIKEENKRHEEQLVQDYVECLQENHTQRDYCARQVGSEYHYMDLLIENYGYTYEQVGYDLYLVNSESVNK